MIDFLSDKYLETLVTHMRRGGVVGLPTETVYGLAADATQDDAVSSIYALKKRPSFNPLIIHVDSFEMASKWGNFTPCAVRCVDAFWKVYPFTRAVTLVVNRTPSTLSHLTTAGLDTVAIRMPNHADALAVIKAYGSPLAAPSANHSNSISPTSASDVYTELGNNMPYIVDGGRCAIGLESTILDVTGDVPVILRHGHVTRDEIAYVFSVAVSDIHISDGDKIQAPGMMKRHYAPSRPLRLNVTTLDADEVLLGFGDVLNAQLNLSPTGNLKEAAANMFKMLRELDQDPYKKIAVSSIPDVGLGIAINDRLKRAAVPYGMVDDV
jgi:L-threonylcarbamoyladenylate synthase